MKNNVSSSNLDKTSNDIGIGTVGNCTWIFLNGTGLDGDTVKESWNCGRLFLLIASISNTDTSLLSDLVGDVLLPALFLRRIDWNGILDFGGGDLSSLGLIGSGWTLGTFLASVSPALTSKANPGGGVTSTY